MCLGVEGERPSRKGAVQPGLNAWASLGSAADPGLTGGVRECTDDENKSTEGYVVFPAQQTQNDVTITDGK